MFITVDKSITCVNFFLINKISFSKNNKIDQRQNQNDDYTLVEAEWESLDTRNIAYSAVIFDEFIKEMAAICQEHGLSTQNYPTKR